MCLILFAFQSHEDYPLVVAANRDEWLERPTDPSCFWPTTPHLLAGRDRRAGGTWLGITRQGRWAAVTNVREPEPPDRGRVFRSRGLLTTDFLQGHAPPLAFLAGLEEERSRYRGFNLLTGVSAEVGFFSNREGRSRQLPTGIHGLSNGPLDLPWPKVRSGRSALARVLRSGPSAQTLLALLADTTPARPEELPDTGLEPELERALSARYVKAPGYGTRSSTVILVHRLGRVCWVERRFRDGPQDWEETRQTFQLEP